ncbi:MAG: pyridoxal-phosphate dependent enzyme [Candidatus Acidiferrales bacterium]
MRCRNILEAIGHTPLVRLNRLTEGLKAEVYVKVDYLNPGGSVKDRIATTMIDDAEQRGLLKPGGTIIEGTSGNTGMGLALLAAVRGYKVIFTITDKQSKEKIDLLKALGAEVIVCPTAVEPEDPRSYYSVARKLAATIPNSYYPNQYENPMNPEAHYQTTGPEIWEDSEGKITHFVIGLGTGGTVTGVARYLKKQNPQVKVVGVDPIGSLYYEYFKTGKVGRATTYVVEGIGEDFFPKTMDLSVLDDIIQITDRDCFLWTRRLARQEAIFTGGSGGGCVYAALQVARGLGPDGFVVAFLADTGMRYLSKIYNDEWMRDNRYLEAEIQIAAEDLVRSKVAASGPRELLSVQPYQTVYHALRLMQSQDVSQVPVFENEAPVGAIYEDHVLKLALEGRDLRKVLIREVMSKPFPVVPGATPIVNVSELITSGSPAVFVELAPGKYDILTKYDVIRAVARLTEKEPRP